MRPGIRGLSLAGEQRCEFLLNGNLPQVVWFLSWPVVVQMILNNLVAAVDMKMVGTLGSDAVAAVGFAQQFIFIIFVTGWGLSVGATATVARYYGQRNRDGLGAAVAQVLLLLLAVSVLSTGIGLSGGSVLLRLLGARGEVFDLAAVYLFIVVLAIPFFMGKMFFWAVFQGAGDTRTPLVMDLFTNVLNVTFNYVLIFGWGPVPALGVKGAALGTFLAHSITAVIALVLLVRNPLFVRRQSRGFLRYNAAELKSILAVGAPAALQGMVQIGANALILAMVARTVDGNLAVSGWSVAIVIFSFAFFPGSAVGTAAACLTGVNLGNNNPDRAYRSGWQCAYMGSLFIAVLAAVMFILAPRLIGFFVADPGVVAIGTPLVRVLSLAEPFHAFGYILLRSMQGGGESRYPFIISVVAWLGVRVPLAYMLVFVFGLQAKGIWYSIALTQILAFCLLVLKYRKADFLHTSGEGEKEPAVIVSQA